MAAFRRARYLSCFYCGRRTSMRYDGHMRQFACAHCEATNYLDENGDITDPPVSTTAAAASSVYAHHATPHSVIHVGDSGDDRPSVVFCPTCLKNQHLFVSSLAQYFPPDPDHPDFAELERRYWRFRRGLEQRYPQVCADCEPAVLARIRQAGYTAKTDHLRRMVRNSRQVRQTRPTLLDAAARLGHWLWWAALVLQALWQVGLLAAWLLAASAGAEGVEQDEVVDGIVDGDRSAAMPLAGPPSAVLHLAALLVWTAAHLDRLRSLCVTATLACCWWNPYFVQTVRGFTKPFLGLPTWYTYQATLVVLRVVLAAADRRASRPAAQAPVLALHACAALLTLVLYAKAPRVIRKDLRPLFAKQPEDTYTQTSTPTPSPRPRTAEEREQDHRRDLDTISDVLDEIAADIPAVSRRRLEEHELASSPLARLPSADRWSTTPSGWPLATPGGPTGTNRQTATGASRRQKSDLGLGALQLNEDDWRAEQRQMQLAQQAHQQPSWTQDPYDDDAMDWTPSQATELIEPDPAPSPSPYRAFQSYGALDGQHSAQASGAFGQTPVGADRGPFWYKVPPAPASIAKRVLSPPSRHLVRKSLDEADGAGASVFSPHTGIRVAGQTGWGADNSQATASSVEFAQPRFFARGSGGGNGHEDALSDLFSQSFTLSGSGQDEGGDGTAPGQRAAKGDSPLWHSATWLRVVWTAVVAFSLALLHGLRVGDGLPNGFGRGPLDGLAKVAETAGVGLCAVTAAVLTRESVRRFIAAGRPGGDPGRPGTPSAWPHSMGCLLGMAAMALAGHMAMQLGAVSGTLPVMDGAVDASATMAAMPWPWWQLATLHGLVLVHQAWNGVL